jgi:hypothetical protein
MHFINLILTTFLLITCLAYGNNTETGEETISCDKYIYGVGGPCIEGVRTSYNGTLDQKHCDINGFILGRDSFNEAVRIFGKAQKWHSGDAAASEDKICFRSQDQTKKVVIVFAANSEMSEDMVDSVRLIQGNVRFLSRCQETTIRPENIKTKSGIHVGMSIDEFGKIMGKPSESRDGLLLYVYCKELKPGDPGYSKEMRCSRCSGIIARFVKGFLQWIKIGVGAGSC